MIPVRKRALPAALLLCAFLLFRPAAADAIESWTAGGKSLSHKYAEIEDRLLKNQFDLPLYIESSDKDKSLRVDVYGIFDYPFDEVQAALLTPAGWCDIALLHINIKACTFAKLDGNWLLTFYNGRKHYQAPEETSPLRFTYRPGATGPGYFTIVLSADEGPLRTKDHRMALEAMPLGEGKTFVHLSYAYRYGFWGQVAMKSYFSTIGRDKVGFSVTGADREGNPVYAAGVKGAIERNAVRYYYAILSYLDTLKAPEDQQFEKRIERWYDLTDRHKRQLHELERSDYLLNKRQEYKNQLILQRGAPLLHQ
ncbi:MAG: hypothetical protein AB1805_11340 [Nitrospirota bacterium]